MTVLITVFTLPVIAVLPVLPTTPVVVPLIYAVSVVMATIVRFVGVRGAWHRSREARLVAAGVSVCTLLGITCTTTYSARRDGFSGPI